jgi:succinate dehydrogenase / fumarate reductase cytochrome b subunit
MATAVRTRARAAATLYALSVGKKIAMAISGVVFFGFVLVHFAGNLKVFQGPEAFNHYAEGLRTIGAPFFARGQLLWVARMALVAALIAHVVPAVQLYGRSWRARPVRYRKFESLAFSQASRTMAWGGVAILAFVVYHLLHLTFGTVHPDFVHGDAYHNFVTGFRSWPVSIVYLAAMVALGLHLYHGVWSATQTFGTTNPGFQRVRRPLALGLAILIAGGNALFPIAVLSGFLQ